MVTILQLKQKRSLEMHSLFFLFIPMLFLSANSMKNSEINAFNNIYPSNNVSFSDSHFNPALKSSKIYEPLNTLINPYNLIHQISFSSKLNLSLTFNQEDDPENQNSDSESINGTDNSENKEEKKELSREERGRLRIEQIQNKNKHFKPRNHAEILKKKQMRKEKRKNIIEAKTGSNANENSANTTSSTKETINEDKSVEKANENQNSSNEKPNHDNRNDKIIQKNSKVENKNAEQQKDAKGKENKESQKEENKESQKEDNKESQKEDKKESQKEDNKKPQKEENKESQKESQKEENKENKESRKEENKESQKEENKESQKEDKKESQKEDNKKPQKKENKEPQKEENKESQKEDKKEENKESQNDSKVAKDNTETEVNDKVNNDQNEPQNDQEVKADANQNAQEKDTNSNNNEQKGYESEQTENDEPPEGPIDSDYEEALMHNAFDQQKKEPKKKKQETKSPEDEMEAKQRADEECNKAKPNTVSGYRGDCVCKPGYVGDNPITERGCWRCADENSTALRNGRQCNSQAKCIYPGRCMCEGGLLGDGVNRCESPVPDIINVKTVYNSLIYMDENSNVNDKPLIESIKVFYNAPYDFVPFLSFCKFDLAIPNEDEMPEQTVPNETESNQTIKTVIGFNDDFRQFQLINGAIDKDKSISCLLPPNFYRYLSESNKQQGKCKVSISFDGLNFTNFKEFDIKETSETGNDGKLLDLPPQRTPVPFRKNRIQQTKKPISQTEGTIVIDKNILIISICMQLIFYLFLRVTKIENTSKKEEEIPFLNVEDKSTEKTQYEGTRKRVLL